MYTRLALSFLMMVVLQLVFATGGQAQSITTDKVTLGLNDESLQTAIKKIEQQSVFRFFYHNADIAPADHLTLAPATRTIEQTLWALLKNTNLRYRQVDHNILLEREQQFTYAITGKVMDSLDKTPVANASVFLNTSTIGTSTGKDGSFALTVTKPGKYDLIISVVGYAACQRTIVVDKGLSLLRIEITPIIISLAEVKVKPDPHWERNFRWFKKEFLGNSAFAGKCRILNPDVLDLSYNEKTGVLTGSSTDFIEIENQALGYKLKYILKQFSSVKREGKVNYNGSALFEKLAGDSVQQQKWKKNRLKAYRGSAMHFLRSALSDQLDAEGFEVLDLKRNPNKYNPDKTLDSLSETPLQVNDFIRLSNIKHVYALGFKECLYVMYTRLHNNTGNLASLPANLQPNYAKTTVTIIEPHTFFDDYGIIINPESIVFEGYWGDIRVAELLPFDYNPDN